MAKPISGPKGTQPPVSNDGQVQQPPPSSSPGKVAAQEQAPDLTKIAGETFEAGKTPGGEVEEQPNLAAEKFAKNVARQLESLRATMGPKGTDVAYPGDVDIGELTEGALFTIPKPGKAPSAEALRAVLGKDADPTFLAELEQLLDGNIRACRVAQNESLDSIPDELKIQRQDAAQQPARAALRAKLPSGSKRMLAKLGQAYQKVIQSGGRATMAEQPSFDGTATYGSGDLEGAEWFTPTQFELWGAGGVSADTAVQGYLGDCYLLAALSSLALTDPKLLEQMIKDNGDGTFTVTFNEVVPFAGEDGFVDIDPSGKKVEIVVDANVLVDELGYAVGAGFTDVDNDQIIEIGINLIEKAFALYNDMLLEKYPDVRLFGEQGDGYGGIESGFADWVLEVLTGEATSWDGVPPTGSPCSFEDILSAANVGENVVLGSFGFPARGGEHEADFFANFLAKAGIEWPADIPTSGPLTEAQRTQIEGLIAQVWPDGMVPGHAYTVVGTCELDGQTYVILRNPWGQVEPGEGEDDGVFALPIEAAEVLFTNVFFDEDALTANADPTSFTDAASAMNHYVDMVTGTPEVEEVPDPDLVFDPKYAFTRLQGMPTDINAFVQWVLRESYMETLHDLEDYALKVRFYNDLKKQIRDELARAREVLSNYAGAEDTDLLDPPLDTRYFDDTYYGPADGRNELTSQRTTSTRSATGTGSPEDNDFVQQYIAGDVTVEQLVDMYGSGDITKADLQAVYDYIEEDWKASNSTEIDLDDFFHNFVSDRDKVHEDDLQAYIESKRDTLVNEIMEVFDKLSPEEQQALIEFCQEEGLTLGLNIVEGGAVKRARESDGGLDLDTFSKMEGTDFRAFVEKLADAIMDQAFSTMNGWYHGGEGSRLELDNFAFSIELPSVAITAEPPAELELLESALNDPTGNDFVQQYIAGDVTVEQLVAMYGNGDITRADLQAVYDYIEEDWKANSSTEIDLADFSHNFVSDRDKVHEDDLQTYIDSKRETLVNEIMEVFDKLSPEEQQALIEYCQEEGLALGLNIVEGGGVKRAKARDGGLDLDTFSKMEGTDFRAFVEKLADAIMDQAFSTMNGWYHGGEGSNLEIDNFEFTIELPTITCQEGDPPEELALLESALNYSSGGGGDGGDGSDGGDGGDGGDQWSVGQDCGTVAHLKTYIDNLEERLNSVGDDAQLANVDLQNMLQKQQQTLQMMSNVSKMLHDTAMSIIRKIGS